MMISRAPASGHRVGRHGSGLQAGLLKMIYAFGCASQQKPFPLKAMSDCFEVGHA
jgi:hypothetical protein